MGELEVSCARCGLRAGRPALTGMALGGMSVSPRSDESLLDGDSRFAPGPQVTELTTMRQRGKSAA